MMTGWDQASSGRRGRHIPSTVVGYCISPEAFSDSRGSPIMAIPGGLWGTERPINWWGGELGSPHAPHPNRRQGQAYRLTESHWRSTTWGAELGSWGLEATRKEAPSSCVSLSPYFVKHPFPLISSQTITVYTVHASQSPTILLPQSLSPSHLPRGVSSKG
jgi:hypothetical protein